jgi:hypothetical protein
VWETSAVTANSKGYDTLLVDAYRGELLGAAFFARRRALEVDRDRLDKLALLEAIEARTAAVLRPLVERAGLDVGDEEGARGTGVELADAAGDWQALLRGLREALPSFLADFVMLRELAAEPADPALAALIAHEQTISAFTDLELTGHPVEAAAMLRRYLAD